MNKQLSVLGRGHLNRESHGGLCEGRGRGEHVRDRLQAEAGTDCGKEEAGTKGLVHYADSHTARLSVDVRFVLKIQDDLNVAAQCPERVIAATRCIPAPRLRGLRWSFF